MTLGSETEANGKHVMRLHHASRQVHKSDELWSTMKQASDDLRYLLSNAPPVQGLPGTVRQDEGEDGAADSGGVAVGGEAARLGIEAAVLVGPGSAGLVAGDDVGEGLVHVEEEEEGLGLLAEMRPAAAALAGGAGGRRQEAADVADGVVPHVAGDEALQARQRH